MKKHILLGLFAAIYIFIGITFIRFGIFVNQKKSEALTTPIALTLKKIVGPQHISILNFGDIMFDRSVRAAMERGIDPFQNMTSIHHGSSDRPDVVIANLEGPIIEVDREACQKKVYNFQFASTTAQMIKEKGIDMVNIANNHSYDCYRAGLESTKKYLTQAGVGFFGEPDISKSYLVRNIEGKKIAFVGIDQTVQPIPVETFYPLIKMLNHENDYVIVNIHWGTEYSSSATPVQTVIAHALIDNGADVIFGHHPHVIEPVEIYNNKPIFYSLGNFIFDQLGVEVNQGIGARIIFENDRQILDIHPFNIVNKQPTPFKGAEKTSFCSGYLKKIQIATECTFILEN